MKAHVGGQAADAAADLGAMAYTTGERVAFARSPDLHTAAHEAAHVVQQRGGVSLEDGIGRSGDAYERHADQVADRVVAGDSAEPLLDEASPRRDSGPASTASHQALAVQREPGGQKADADPDADVSLGALDSKIFGNLAEASLGDTPWIVMREILRGIVGGFRSMPEAQRAQIRAKVENFGLEEFYAFQAGYWDGAVEGFLGSVVGLGKALITLVTLPYEIDKFLLVTAPELVAKYMPRVLLAMQEATDLAGQLYGSLRDPALLRKLLEVVEGWALPKIRSIGHGIANKIIGLMAEPWAEYGHDVGIVVGQALFEVLLAVFSEGLANIAERAVLVSARLLEGAVEALRALRGLLGDLVAWLVKLGGRVLGELAGKLAAVIRRVGGLLDEVLAESAVTDAGVSVRVPDARGPTVLEARAKPPAKPTSGGTSTTVADLKPANVHPSNAEPPPVPKPKDAATANATGKQQDFEGKLRGDQVTLPGIRTQRITVTKRDSAITRRMRTQFDSTHRPKFLIDLANDPDKVAHLKKLGLTEDELAKMRAGEMPSTKYQVHHKIPLDVGGENEVSNFIFMENEPYHKTISAEHLRKFRNMKPGQTLEVDWPMPDGDIYP